MGEIEPADGEQSEVVRSPTAGAFLVIAAPVGFGLIYVALKLAMSVIARNSVAPDQGAMFVAFLILVFAAILSLVGFVSGIILLSRWSIRENRSDRER